MEAFSIKIICKTSKNILISTQHSDPSSKGKIFEKLEIKHLKDPGNQRAFKGVPKENKNYTKRFCKKKQNQCRMMHII